MMRTCEASPWENASGVLQLGDLSERTSFGGAETRDVTAAGGDASSYVVRCTLYAELPEGARS
jgi:hypothetical protein